MLVALYTGPLFNMELDSRATRMQRWHRFAGQEQLVKETRKAAPAAILPSAQQLYERAGTFSANVTGCHFIFSCIYTKAEYTPYI